MRYAAALCATLSACLSSLPAQFAVRALSRVVVEVVQRPHMEESRTNGLTIRKGARGAAGAEGECQGRDMQSRDL